MGYWLLSAAAMALNLVLMWRVWPPRRFDMVVLLAMPVVSQFGYHRPVETPALFASLLGSVIAGIVLNRVSAGWGSWFAGQQVPAWCLRAAWAVSFLWLQYAGRNTDATAVRRTLLFFTVTTGVLVGYLFAAWQRQQRAKRLVVLLEPLAAEAG